MMTIPSHTEVFRDFQTYILNTAVSSLQRLVYCLNDGWYGSFMNWASAAEVYEEMLPVVLKVCTCIRSS